MIFIRGPAFDLNVWMKILGGRTERERESTGLKLNVFCFPLASSGGKDQGAVRSGGAEADEGDERQYNRAGYRQSPYGATLRGERGRRADPGHLHGRGLRDR